jgi:hypothetical protein
VSIKKKKNKDKHKNKRATYYIFLNHMESFVQVSFSRSNESQQPSIRVVRSETVFQLASDFLNALQFLFAHHHGGHFFFLLFVQQKKNQKKKKKQAPQKSGIGLQFSFRFHRVPSCVCATREGERKKEEHTSIPFC